MKKEAGKENPFPAGEGFLASGADALRDQGEILVGDLLDDLGKAVRIEFLVFKGPSQIVRNHRKKLERIPARAFPVRLAVPDQSPGPVQGPFVGRDPIGVLGLIFEPVVLVLLPSHEPSLGGLADLGLGVVLDAHQGLGVGIELPLDGISNKAPILVPDSV